MIIPYAHPTKKKICRYLPDFYVKIKERSGRVVQYIIEVKPQKEANKPNNSKRKKPATRLYEKLTYVQNVAKWQSAQDFAKRNGMVFKVITENELRL